MQIQSENINELIGALSKAQGKIELAKKNKQNTFVKNKYADLSSAWEACRRELSEVGIAVVQGSITIEGQLNLFTTLAHSSGQWMRSFVPLIPRKNDEQGLGSAITYMRRYSLCAMVGIAPDDPDLVDDDGEKAVGRGKKKKTTIHSIEQEKPKEIASPEEIEAFVNEVGNKNILANVEKWLIKNHKCTLYQMPKDVCQTLTEKYKNREMIGG